MPLRVLLHRAWLERKKNFESIIEFPRHNPFCTEQIGFHHGNAAPRLLVVKADFRACSAECTQCCTLREAVPRLTVGFDELQKIGDRLPYGGCSGLISLADYRVSELPGALERWNCAVPVSPEQFINGTGNLAEEKLEQFCSRLSSLLETGIAIAPLILVSGELEQNLHLLVKLAELQLPALTVFFNVSDCPTDTPKSVEQYGMLGAMVRILNPKAELGFVCIGTFRQQTSLLEQYALNAGFNAISCPSEETVSLAKDLGLEPRFKERCCLVRPRPRLEETPLSQSN